MKKVTSTYHQQNWTTCRPWCVYAHRSPSDSYYIGISKRQRLSIRWVNGAGYKTCYAFHNAIMKYGWENFEHFIIAEGLTEEEAKMLEINEIKKYKLIKKSYNIAAGGQGASRKCSDETKRKISLAQKGKPKPREQVEKMMLTKRKKQYHATFETRKKTSESLKRTFMVHPELLINRSKHFSQTYWMNDGTKNKRVHSSMCEIFLEKGWKFGRIH